MCQLTAHAQCYYRLGSDEATYYETHSSDWRCQDCGGPQRHADCVISSHEQVIQRHVGPRFSNRGYPASGDDGVAAGAAKNLRSDCVLLDDEQIADFRPTTGGLLSSGRGGGAVGSAATPHRSALRRDLESVDYDMPDPDATFAGDGDGAAGAPYYRSILGHDKDKLDCDMLDLKDADPSTPSRPLVAAADCAPLLTDAMFVAPNTSNSLTSLPSGDYPMLLDPPPNRQRVPKKKKWYKNGQGGHQRQDFKDQGWTSRRHPPPDSPL